MLPYSWPGVSARHCRKIIFCPTAIQMVLFWQVGTRLPLSELRHHKLKKYFLPYILLLPDRSIALTNSPFFWYQLLHQCFCIPRNTRFFLFSGLFHLSHPSAAIYFGNSQRTNTVLAQERHGLPRYTLLTDESAIILQSRKTKLTFLTCVVFAAVMYELDLALMVQFWNRAVDGPKIKSVVPSI